MTKLVIRKLLNIKNMTQKLEPIKIAFGDEFIDNSPENSRRVIELVGNGATFESSRVVDKDGKEALTFAGSAHRNRIDHLTGERWSLERIIEAKMNFYDDKEPVGRYYDLLRKNAEDETRMLGE